MNVPHPLRIPHRTAGGRSGFALSELLVSMFVISILLGMILSAIRAVHRHSYRTVALGEVKGIEGAWKQYYAHYQIWPNLVKEGAYPQSDTTYRIDKTIALALQGDEQDDPKINPDNLPLMEFIHFDKDGNPINPWGLTSVDVNRCYFVRFDHDGDGRIALPDCGQCAGNRSDPAWKPDSYAETDDDHVVRAGVIVWTYNPEIHVGDTDGSGVSRNKERIVGSWKE
jgi:prepilin-type N-terminal cleavage/methylation domain-containing protein